MLSYLLHKKEPLTLLFRKFWIFAGKERKIVILHLVMFIISNLILLVTPFLFGKLVGEIQTHGIQAENLSKILKLIGLFLVKDLAFWAFHGPARVIERIAAFKVALRYRDFLLKGMLDFNLSWHQLRDTGDSIDKMNKAVTGLFEFGQTIFIPVQIIVRLFGTFVCLLFLAPPMAAIVLVFSLVSLLITFRFDQKILPKSLKLNQLSNQAQASFFDTLSNITTVKILHIENPITEGVARSFARSIPIFSQIAKLNEWKWFSGVILFQLVNVIPLGGYILYSYYQKSPIDGATFSTLYLYLSEMIFVFTGFASYYENIMHHRNGVINAESLEQGMQEENRERAHRLPISFQQTLAIHRLSFSFNSLRPPLFHQLPFEFKFHKNEKIALLGKSGSGKSTFLKIIHGIYEQAEAELQLDNGPLMPVKFFELDLSTMLVPQEPEIFSATIRENMTLGLIFSTEEIMHAIELSMFSEVLANLPGGLDSVLSEKGVNLSGGQKQRLALARAILFAKSKEMVLLDESTSSVDIENESKIYQNIFHTFQDKIVIAAIHKFHLLKHFDRIIFFDSEQKAYAGTIEEVKKYSHQFHQLWSEYSLTSSRH